MKKLFWVLKTSIRFCFWYILVYVMVVCLQSGITLATNVLNQHVINELADNIFTGVVSKTLITLLLAYIALFFIRDTGGRFLGVFGINFFRNNVNSLFHRIFLWKSSRTPQECFFDHKFMEQYSFVDKNTNKISDYIVDSIDLIFGNIGILAGYLILFSIYEPWLIGYAVIIAAASLLLNKNYIRKKYELDKRQVTGERFHDYYKKLLTEKESAKELRLFHLADTIYEKWLQVYEHLRLEKLELQLQTISLWNYYDILRLGLRIAAILLLLIGIWQKRYDVGTFVMLFDLVERCADRINNLTDTLMRGAYKDIKYMIDYCDFIGPLSTDEIKDLLREQIDSGNLAFGPFQSLCAENISYTYPGNGKKAVQGVSFSIKKGEIVSILGFNGSGKTTLSKLLNNSLSPQEGTILINGVPYCESNQTDIFCYFGNAPQEFARFSLRLRDFVGLGRIEKMYDEEALTEAYRKADMSTFLRKYEQEDHVVLDKKYDEDGIDLSGGEWQRLVIASSYMGDPEILIMDEPTASIDPLKEMEMLHNFRNNLSGRTAILISHRIGFARLADRIVFMENGQITEQGSHEELLLQNGSYARLFREQQKLYES